MSELIEALRTAVFESASNDGEIVATLTRSDGIQVQFAPGVSNFVADDLEQAVSELVYDLIAQHKEAVKDLIGEHSFDNKMERYRKNLDDAIENIEVTGRSEGNWAIFDWCGESDAQLILRADAPQVLGHRELESKVNDAIRAAFSMHRQEAKKVRDESIRLLIS
ncbi:hypothetical protein FB566_2526 [Stackebrandtia endophytica]|uniref:Uncharacterized protein n=1 Tax=Stackebrandtia endophytica TaxID=1496996 RepID=A0A543AWN4_9ACTN|nr:hypothetical protein [Stackebrandtia endophytica]TQL76982.1 hypothetical protein FB566_2526 [Stackebrandtia endophytica]